MSFFARLGAAHARLVSLPRPTPSRPTPFGDALLAHCSPRTHTHSSLCRGVSRTRNTASTTSRSRCRRGVSTSPASAISCCPASPATLYTIGPCDDETRTSALRRRPVCPRAHSPRHLQSPLVPLPHCSLAVGSNWRRRRRTDGPTGLAWKAGTQKMFGAPTPSLARSPSCLVSPQ